jgi:hypothetical protein
MLFEADPLRNGISFANGTYSTVYKGFLPYRISEDIGFTGAGQGFLQIANEDNREASFVDLGSQETVASEYKINGPQHTPYLSIHLDGNNDFTIAESFFNQTWQTLKMEQLLPLEQLSKGPIFQPEPNHVYIIKITDANAENRQVLRIVKMVIVHWIPPAKFTGQPSVGIRWDILRDNQDARGQMDNCLIAGDEPEDIPDLQDIEHQTANWVTELLIGMSILMGILFFSVLVIFVRQQMYFNRDRDRESYGVVGTYTEIKSA